MGNLLLAHILVSTKHDLGNNVLKDIPVYYHIEYNLVITLHSTMEMCY